jgi:hypothetical protein
MPRLHWLDEPEHHDYAAAADYLSLVLEPDEVEELVGSLKKAGTVRRKAKDILRASGLEPLPRTNPHVAADLAKDRLSPVLLVRDTRARRLIVADGYHRVCASYWVDEDSKIPCRLV